MIGMRKLGMAECGKHSDKAFCKVILDQDQEPKLSSHSVRRVSAIEDFAPPPPKHKKRGGGNKKCIQSKSHRMHRILDYRILFCKCVRPAGQGRSASFELLAEEFSCPGLIA